MRMKKILIFLSLVIVATPALAQGQEIMQDLHETVKAVVLEASISKSEPIPGTDTEQPVQQLKVKVLEGTAKGRIVDVRNDFTQLRAGETFYLNHIAPWDGGTEQFGVSEPYRLPQLGWLLAIFLALVVIFGGKQGVRGIISLAGSLVFILFALIPGILHGYSPVLLSIGVASLIIILGSYVTHGFNRTTSSAVIGMVVTVLLVGLFAHFAIGYVQLSGFTSDETTYLNFNSRGALDLAGILLGGIIIGLLGVMYDAAIGQAISVEELHRIAPHVDRRTVYRRALRIGREHIGALVNTLAIAYVGASLPLLLLFYSSPEGIAVTINREIFATEIVRSLVGSIGLVLTVPVTTLISVWMVIKRGGASKADAAQLDAEKHALEHDEGHSHAGHRH